MAEMVSIRYILNQESSGELMKSVPWIVGGICIGLGMLCLIGAFGDTGLGLLKDGVIQPASTSYAAHGYDASMDLELTQNGIASLVLLAVGLILMIRANATAWLDTDNEY